jgi:hypothetical protein
VFVAKKGSKWRPVVDLRGLNQLMVPDTYPLPRQEDIVETIRGKWWLSVFDITSAYYQRRVRPSDWWKLAIATHCGHEIFTVTPMGLINSPAHQQKYMDKLLRFVRWRIACCYIDDIIVFSASFEDHIHDLNTVLTLLQDAGLTPNPLKCFVGYHTLQLLGQAVDSLGLTTTEERAHAILEQPWPRCLAALEYFVGICGYTRHLIPYYAQIMEPLQQLKTDLLRSAPYKGKA